MGGAVAGGNPQTMEAGRWALRRGGNAVDAAVAAQLMACVSEPLLTGLGGGGLAVVRVGGRTRVLDFFSDVPGLGGGLFGEPMREVAVDFGPTTQIFHYGAGSVAVPSLVFGLCALHDAHGSLPLSTLVEPAVAGARDGVAMSVGLTRSVTLLAPIIATHPTLAGLFLDGEASLPAGHVFRQPALARTLHRIGAEGADFLRRGDGAADLLATARGRLTARDLQHYTPKWRAALEGRYRGAILQLPGPPSQAGLQVLRTLAALEAGGPLPADPLGGAHLRRLAEAMQVNEAAKGADFQVRLFDPGFAETWLAGCRSGYTTHISTVDSAGNAVGITSSLGETAGLITPETGLILNNFLGEADVNPPSVGLPAGARLMTMCCPTLLLHDDRLLVLGSGGSSRIRSALVHGVVYTVDHGLPPNAMVDAPRAHFEEGVLRYETVGRPEGHDDAVAPAFPRRIRFDAPGLFFGGLHVAGRGPEGFFGAGDHRRSGEFGVVPQGGSEDQAGAPLDPRG